MFSWCLGRIGPLIVALPGHLYYFSERLPKAEYDNFRMKDTTRPRKFTFTSVLAGKAQTCEVWKCFKHLQTNIDTIATSVDPDEMVHQGLHYLPSLIDLWLKPLFATIYASKFKYGSVDFRNSGVKGIKVRSNPKRGAVPSMIILRLRLNLIQR